MKKNKAKQKERAWGDILAREVLENLHTLFQIYVTIK